MKMLRLRTLFITIFLAGLAAILSPGHGTAQAAPLQQANILNNGGLEEPYSNGAPQGWGRWHQEFNANPKPANCSDRYLVQPKWSPELNGALIREGSRSAHVGNQFDTWRGGLMQNVAVTAGSTYRFTFYANGRASNEQYPAPSDASVNMGVRAGIDPNGSGLWSDADVVWGGFASPHDTWVQVTVEATATSNQITVFMQADNGGANQCRAHLDVWFDGATLVAAGPPATATSPPQPTSPPPPPAPVVTNTPLPPTETPTPEFTPTNTPEPTPIPTNTPIPPSGGTICLNAFSDADANGQRGEEEGYMAGVTFTIAKDDAIVTQGVSTGTDNPLCFEELEPGSYQVAQILPRNLETTTAPNTTIDVQEGSSISLEFGSRFETASPAGNENGSGGQEVAEGGTGSGDGNTAGNANSNDGSETGNESADNGDGPLAGFNVMAIVGLVVVGLVILVLIVVIIILISRARA